jgi:hypothetical protein
MKTAVEYIKKRIEEDSDTSFSNIDWDKFDEIIEQAKEMEKQQIILAYEQGYRDGETNSNTVNYGIDISKFADAKIYYNETFKQQEQ